MRLTLQIITVLVFVGIMYAIHQGAGAIADWGGPQFTMGLLVGGVFTAGFLLFANWLEKKLPSDRRGE